MLNDKIFRLRLPSDEHAAWSKQAEEQGVSLSEWVRERCNAERQPKYRARKPSANELVVQPEVGAILACGHEAEPGKPGMCRKWGCGNYAFAR